MHNFRDEGVAKVFIGDECIGKGDVLSLVVYSQPKTETPDMDTTLLATIEVSFRISAEHALGIFGGHPSPDVN